MTALAICRRQEQLESWEYGDIYPVTAGGRVFTFVVLMLGLGVVAVPADLLVTALSKARAMDEASKELEG